MTVSFIALHSPIGSHFSSSLSDYFLPYFLTDLTSTPSSSHVYRLVLFSIHTILSPLMISATIYRPVGFKFYSPPQSLLRARHMSIYMFHRFFAHIMTKTYFSFALPHSTSKPIFSIFLISINDATPNVKPWNILCFLPFSRPDTPMSHQKHISSITKILHK